MDNTTKNEITARPAQRRIAIIGAGAAGLTAAETLRRKGYTQVTIFERSKRAGGKCSTVDIDGKCYELGAGILAASNKTVLALAKQYNVRTKRAIFGKSLLVDAFTGAQLAKRNRQDTLTVLQQLFFQYRTLTRRYKNITNPGWLNVPAELCVPFSVWAKQHGIEQLATELAAAFTGYGYDYFENIPAAYVLKYYSWETIRSFVLRRMYIFPDGIQRLWNTIAATHNIKYNTAIQKITRTDASVRIYTNSGEQFEYDRLIITSPLDEALQFLDASEEEHALFSQIQYVDYRTVACELHNFPKYSGYIPGNHVPKRSGHPVFWYHRHHETDIYTFYVLAKNDISDDTVSENVAQFVACMGGEVKRVHTVARWKYFPHVQEESMHNNYFDQLEALQGKRCTYYAGELLNFSTVGLTADYAQHIITCFF